MTDEKALKTTNSLIFKLCKLIKKLQKYSLNSLFYITLQLKRYIIKNVNLIIDIGNTQAKLVAFDGDCPIEEVRTSNTTLEGLDAFIKKYNFKRGIVTSVINLSSEIERQLKAIHFPVLRFNANTPIPINNCYRTPQTLGSDRLAAVIGAYMQHPNHNILVIDAGTCLTYEFIDYKGNYWGGNITSGLQMRLRAMHTFTAKLPLIESQGDTPELGYDTETAMRSGVITGITFEIEGYIRYYRHKYPDLLVFLTGGDEFNFDASIKNIIFADKYLVPRGLNRILNFNNDKFKEDSL